MSGALHYSFPEKTQADAMDKNKKCFEIKTTQEWNFVILAERQGLSFLLRKNRWTLRRSVMRASRAQPSPASVIAPYGFSSLSIKQNIHLKVDNLFWRGGVDEVRTFIVANESDYAFLSSKT